MAMSQERESTTRMFIRHPMRYLRALSEVQKTGHYTRLWEVYERMGKEHRPLR